MPNNGDEFWQGKTLQDLQQEQKVQPVSRISDVLGRGSELWADDSELEQFLDAIDEKRDEDSAA
jgi:hypothetical protein